MKDYLENYIKETEKELEKNLSKDELIELKNDHLNKIKFFQHERLIHLLVTLFYCLFFLIFIVLGTIYIGFYVVSLILLIFILAYIVYYFYLENNIKYLYFLYDIINEKIKDENPNNIVEAFITKIFDKLSDKFLN